MTDGLALLRLLSDRPVAYHPDVARIIGGVKAAVFLCQLLYWTGKGSRVDGFIWKTQAEMEEETALTRSEQEGARRKLKKLGVLDEKLAGIPAKLHYRVDTVRFLQLVKQFYSNQDCGKPANCDAENEQSITESTQESTQETTVPAGAGRASEGKQQVLSTYDLDDVVFEMGDAGLRKAELTVMCEYCGETVTQEMNLCKGCGAIVVWKHSPTWKKLYGNPTTFIRRLEKPDLAPKTPLEVKAVEVFGSGNAFAHNTQAKTFRTLARGWPEGYILKLIAWAKKKRVPFGNFETAVRSQDNLKDWERKREEEAKSDNEEPKDPNEEWDAYLAGTED